MKGRIWLLSGIAAGIVIGLVRVPYLTGAATSLVDTLLRVAGTGALSLEHSAARHGAPRRLVEGLAGLVGAVLPGLLALVLVATARLTLRLRLLVGLVLVALGGVTYVYAAGGAATGVLLLALVAAAIAVAATGPFVAAPLAGLAALVGTTFLPRLVRSHTAVAHHLVTEVHEALFATSGSPWWLACVLLVVAVVPFALAGRLALR